MKAIRVHEVGGPEVMTLEDVPRPNPTAGEARVRLEAIGVNYIDTYHRTGLYKVPRPFTPGMEAAGVVDAVGPDVKDVRAGDRVAYAGTLGAYAEQAVVPVEKLVTLPDGLETKDAAAALLQGLTAQYLTRSTFPLKPGHTVLIHAAAGGVGLLLVQAAKHLGARVLGTVSTDEKERAATEAGADAIMRYEKMDFAAEVKKLTEGRGVDVVYDPVGKSTYEKSIASLAPRGMLVLFGNASGPVPPIDPLALSAAGSIFLTRPTLFHHVATREELLSRSRELFSWLQSGKLRLTIHRSLPLGDASQAHRLLEGRKTTGKLLLVP
ncbi:MAG: quinone oxidoreductase family protein [Vicinamibacteria bacterium]